MHESMINRYRALVSAVILQALIDYQYGLKGRKNSLDNDLESARASDDAARWLNSDDTYKFSFIWCCDVLGFHPDRIRYRMDTRDLLKELRSVRAEQSRHSERRRINAEAAVGGY